MIKTFFPEWKEASLAFVPAGSTLRGMDPDSNPEIIHVDTGFGKFDHHQTDEDTCASLLVYGKLRKSQGDNKPLERLVNVVNDIDHFREVFFPNPTADYWDLSLVSAIDGWRLLYPEDPVKVVALVMDTLDAVYKTFQNKVWAEKELGQAIKFPTKWGESIALETVNDEVVHLGQKKGYVLVVRKDPNKGYLRIKSLPKPEIDLTPLYDKLSSEDRGASWFLHASRHMILNGSVKNPEMKPSSLTLKQVIDVISSLK
jgi:hypothetical protein